MVTSILVLDELAAAAADTPSRWPSPDGVQARALNQLLDRWRADGLKGPLRVRLMGTCDPELFTGLTGPRDDEILVEWGHRLAGVAKFGPYRLPG